MLRDYLRHLGFFSSGARLFLTAQFPYCVAQATVWVLRNLYLEAAGFDPAFIGLTLSVSAMGMLPVALLLTHLMDRMRLKGFLFIGVFFAAGGLAGVATFSGKVPILACCFLSGVGMALYEACTAPFFMRHSSPVERPFLFGVGAGISPTAGLLTTLGLAAGAALMGEQTSAYRMMLLAGAGVSLAALPFLAMIREAPADPPPPEPEKFDWSTAGKFCTAELIFGLGAGLTIPFLNLYFRLRHGQPAGTISTFYSGAQVLMMVAFLLSPLFSRRFGPVRTIVGFQLASLPFLVVLALTTSLPLALGAFLMRHACMNMVHPVSTNFIMERAPARQRARFNGLKRASWYLSIVVASAAGGWLIDNTTLIVDGFTTVMAFTIGLYLAGSVLYWVLFRRENQMNRGSGGQATG